MDQLYFFFRFEKIRVPVRNEPFPGEQVGLADDDIVSLLLEKKAAQRGFQGFFFQHFQESLSVGQVEAGELFVTQCRHYDTPPRV